LKVNRLQASRSPFDVMSVVLAAFVILIIVSEIVAESSESSVLNYYVAGKTGAFDGIVAPCFRSWQNYINMDPGSEQAVISCPGHTGDFASFPFTISNQTSVYNVPGVEFYPIYKTSAFVSLSPTANQSVPMDFFGLGYSQNVDNLLRSALVVGALPASGAGYEVAITDTLASAYGLRVGQSLNITGEGLWSTPAPGEAGLQNLSRQVVISGILSESALNREFNVAGIPVFVQGTFGGGQTETALGYRIHFSGGVEGCMISVPVSSSPCTVGPELFGIFSNNMMNDLFGFNVTGPDEVLFRFSSEPTIPNYVLDAVSQIQTEFSGAPNVVALTWGSQIALIGVGSNLLNPVTASAIDLFDNASAVSQAGPVMGDVAPILALQASPVVDRLQSVAYSAQVLTLDALVFCVVVELAVFGIVRKRFVAQLEIYKGIGIGHGRAFRELLKRHAMAPLKWGIGASVLTALGIVIGVDPFVPLALVATFLSLVVLELAYLTFTSFRVRQVRQFGKERTG
jgi:hypothetical protein